MRLRVCEEWREVRNTDNRYYVSSLGRVKSVKKGKELILKPHLNNGYEILNIFYKAQQKTSLVHILVADAFLGVNKEGFYVNHKDGNKSNNRLWNLEYVTPSENTYHAFNTGLNKSGEDHPNSKLKNKDIVAISILLDLGYSEKDLAEKFGVHQRTISRVKYKESNYRRFDGSSVLHSTVVASLGDKTLRRALEVSKEDCPEDRIPVVVFHQHGTSNDFITLSFEDFLRLVPKENVVGVKQ